jgi:hypothetical protein
VRVVGYPRLQSGSRRRYPLAGSSVLMEVDSIASEIQYALFMVSIVSVKGD